MQAKTSFEFKTPANTHLGHYAALTWLEGADIILQKGFCKEVKLPLYEYECTQCGKRIEKIQKFSDFP